MTKTIFKFLSQFCPKLVRCVNTNAVSRVAGRTNQIRTGDLYHVKVVGTVLKLHPYPYVFSALLDASNNPTARTNRAKLHLNRIGINSAQKIPLLFTRPQDLRAVSQS